jgi:hypothetical protein
MPDVDHGSAPQVLGSGQGEGMVLPWVF